MLTRKFDSAFDAMIACRARTVALRDCFRAGSAERSAVEALLTALERVDRALAPDLAGLRARRDPGEGRGL